jgi:UDPglucose 6-dehydrogenase
MKSSLKSPVVVDLRNIYRPAELAVWGCRYSGVGRG